MFSRGIAIALAAASAGMFASPAFAYSHVPAVIDERAPRRQKEQKRQDYWSVGPQFRRSKNPPTKRKLKANRLHISKRVRRKHRRAR